MTGPPRPASGPAGPDNPDFETGDLTGWTVLSGDAFAACPAGDHATGRHGAYHLCGADRGDAARGRVRSTSWTVAHDRLGFLIGGGWDPERLYVALVRDGDGAVLCRQTGPQGDEQVRIVWDTAPHRGERVHLEVVDDAVGEWGHLHLDDVRVGDRITDDTGLTLPLLGRANQPVTGTDADRYAADPLRPQFHYTPFQGWINDPNGLIQWRGRHHLFSQAHPAVPLWDRMHWLHASGADPVRWRNEPVALVPPPPRTPADRSGIFSGCAVDDGGVLTLIYTVFTDTVAHPGAPEEVIGLATSTDGVTFRPEPEPVVAGPPPGSAAGWRDPKVFRDPADGSWTMVVGSGDGGRGRVHLYRSADLRAWAYRGVLFEGDPSTGPMWECPDLFPIGPDWVLIESSDDRVHWWVGTYDGTRFVPRTHGVLDGGPAFYAAQHYTDDAGRPLVIGWLGRWGAREPTRVGGWAGVQSITRELFVRPDGVLGSRPVAEVASLRGAPLPVPRGDALDLVVEGDDVTLRVRESAAEATVVRYAAGRLTLDTRRSGYGDGGVWSVPALPGPVRVLVDRSTIEVFAAGGEALTARIHPRYAESTGVGVTGARALTAWPMGSAWA